MLRLTVLILIASVTFTSCGEDKVYTPKPRLYPRIDFPSRGFQKLDREDCPFTFSYPVYATVAKDKNVFEDEAPDGCWFNLNMPALNGALHCSYIAIDDEEEFNKIIRDAFKIVSEHNIKANYRDEKIVKNSQGVEGLTFDISGPVATPFQFYLTDTINHFFRASLYFNSQVNPDSMAPVHEFVIEDVQEIINTFEWN